MSCGSLVGAVDALGQPLFLVPFTNGVSLNRFDNSPTLFPNEYNNCVVMVPTWQLYL